MKSIACTITSVVFCSSKARYNFTYISYSLNSLILRKKWHRLKRIVNKNRNFFYPIHDQRYFENYMVCAVSTCQIKIINRGLQQNIHMNLLELKYLALCLPTFILFLFFGHVSGMWPLSSPKGIELVSLTFKVWSLTGFYALYGFLL